MKEYIFRAYDVRGVYGKDLDENTAKLIGKAFGTFIGAGRTVGAGKDVRTSGDALKKNLIEGLASVGCNVIDFGLTTTPMLSILIKNRRLDGGVMVTASHNPKEWNGFIFIDSDGHFCSEGMGMEKIRDIFFNKNFFEPDIEGKISKENALEDYKKFILSKVRINKKLKVVVDPGNGATSFIASDLFRSIGCEVISINDYWDGNFPSRIPDVTEEALLELKKKVLECNADIGFAYDCDGDRAAFIDDKGRYMGSGNVTIAIFAEYYLKRNKNAKIVFDVTCSSSLEDFIRSKGGIPVINRVGHAFIVNRMIEEGAIFGGEYSNHLYFSEIYGFDDAIFASLKMAEIISNESRKISEIVDAIPRYYSSGVKEISCPDEKKFKVIERIKERMKKENYRILELDGVKVFLENGNFLIRASNTLPSIKLNAESKSEEDMKKLFNLAMKIVQEELEKI